MFKMPILLAIACSLLATTASGEQPELPAPPNGFEWQWCDEVRVGILKPAGWHFKRDTKNDTEAYFITKEKIEPEKGFFTGLILNVLSGVGKKTKGRASSYAKKFIREAMRDKEFVVKEIPQATLGPAKTIGCRITKDDSTVHYFLVSDDRYDKLYLFFFEAPSDAWEAEWKIGDENMKKLLIEFPEN